MAREAERQPEIMSHDRPQKITLAEMRASGVRGLPIYCSDYRCSHWMANSGDRWPDVIRLSDLEPRLLVMLTANVARMCGPIGNRLKTPTNERRRLGDRPHPTHGHALVSAGRDTR